MTTKLPWLLLPVVAALAYALGGRHTHTPPSAVAQTQAAQAEWTCSMHPQVRQPDKGTCPICGMDLTPAAATQTSAKGDTPARISISERARIRARLRTSVVRRDPGNEKRALLYGRVVGDVVELSAYDSDQVHVGQSATFTSLHLPGQQFAGAVQKVEGKRVVASITDQRKQLAPGSVVEARLGDITPAGWQPPLLVPASAPLFTGKRALVYVAILDMAVATYEARVVELGPKLRRADDDYYPVLSGLSESEQVVSNGSFVLDADAQLRAGISMMAMDDDIRVGAKTSLAGRNRGDEWLTDTIVQTPIEHHQNVHLMQREYFKLQQALAASNLDEAKSAALAMGRYAQAVHAAPQTEFQLPWNTLSKRLDARSGEIGSATDIERARVAFQDLSIAMVQLLRTLGNGAGESVRIVHCPMAFNGKGAQWAQLGSDVLNPYYGEKMLHCGNVIETVAAGQHMRSNQKLVGQRN